MNRSTPGLPVHHQLLEFTQTHVHQVSDTIQPSYPLSSPSPPASNPSQHQSLCNESTLRMRWPKFWKVKDVYKKQTFTEGIQAKKKTKKSREEHKENKGWGDSQVVQWLSIHLAIQGTWVQSQAMGQLSPHAKLENLHAATTEPLCSTAQVPQLEGSPSA